jgi:hypothetical protein
VSSKSVDKKPILDLLAEFKAEIINEVEEEIEDEVRTGYNEGLAMGNPKKSVLRIRDVYPGSDFFPSRIPDLNCLHPGSSSKNSSILTPKKAKKWLF